MPENRGFQGHAGLRFQLEDTATEQPDLASLDGAGLIPFRAPFFGCGYAALSEIYLEVEKHVEF
jgi:hypothetical protein